jgi:hypothetical protein
MRKVNTEAILYSKHNFQEMTEPILFGALRTE